MKVYIIQIDFSEGDQVYWENADPAYKNLEQAQKQQQWIKEHYGLKEHQLRIETLELV
jgi:hypothetical protein